MKMKTFVPDPKCEQKDQCVNKYLAALFQAQQTGKLVGVPNCSSCKYRPE